MIPEMTVPDRIVAAFDDTPRPERIRRSGEWLSYRAWLVDLDGTLYRASWLKFAMGVELVLFGAADIPVIREFRKEHERLRSQMVEPNPNPYEEQLRRTAQCLGRDLTSVRRIVERWMLDRPARWLRRFCRRTLITEIETFRGLGGRVALVSDYPARDKLVAMDASQLFDVTVAIGEPGGPGRLKPWPDGYLLAAERLTVAPRDCLVLGDRQDADGLAAQRAGMHFRHIR